MRVFAAGVSVVPVPGWRDDVMRKPGGGGLVHINADKQVQLFHRGNSFILIRKDNNRIAADTD